MQGRIFENAIRTYCRGHGIAVESGADGWLLAMRNGTTRRLAFGYDLGLNSAVAHRIACDKSATAELLAGAGIDCVPHLLFMDPSHPGYVPGSAAVLAGLLQSSPQGLVLKPNEGHSGRLVFHVTTPHELDHAAGAIFACHPALAACPFIAIGEEIRIVLLDGRVLLGYAKQREPGNWRHNLGGGAQPVLLDDGPAKQICGDIALAAADAIGIRFAAIDIVSDGERHRVLEINSAVMMEAFGRQYPELAMAAYADALDALFAAVPGIVEPVRPL